MELGKLRLWRPLRNRDRHPVHRCTVGADAYGTGKIIAVNADGSYDVAYDRQIYRNIRNDGFYGVRETPEGQGN